MCGSVSVSVYYCISFYDCCFFIIYFYIVSSRRQHRCVFLKPECITLALFCAFNKTTLVFVITTELNKNVSLKILFPESITCVCFFYIHNDIKYYKTITNVFECHSHIRRYIYYMSEHTMTVLYSI